MKKLSSGSTRAVVRLLALLAVLGVALIVGRDRAPTNTVEARTEAIAKDFKCPTCQGQSVADSKAATAKVIYDEIARRVRSGESDSAIRGFLVDRYGEERLLRPKATGAGAIVWIAPVIGVVVAIAGLALAFRRWRVRAVPTDDDRDLVTTLRKSRGNG